ncbi:hypothetical protein [Streptomyces pacificus]|uniref:Secreted protein n=1 Tax=Streptomyces pacificus TaxID=2705029 RepID=A0A6A0B4R7_9ACTN|nr:hypothetical protein [Streptomyces pacificus]GFH38787.1 hypothetical protein SCWH03_50430 [Streptomyces pacificus]
MPSPRSRWHRALAVVAALTAVLTGALLCAGTSMAAATGGAPEHGRSRLAPVPSAGGAASVLVVPPTGGGAPAAVVPRAGAAALAALAPRTALPLPVPPPVALAAPDGGALRDGTAPRDGTGSPDEQRAPGCGEGSGDGGLDPAVPPRGSAAHELLSVLPAAAHGAAGGPAAGDGVLGPAPGRAPPVLAAPGPIDLSVLRV